MDLGSERNLDFEFESTDIYERQATFVPNAVLGEDFGVSGVGKKNVEGNINSTVQTSAVTQNSASAVGEEDLNDGTDDRHSDVLEETSDPGTSRRSRDKKIKRPTHPPTSTMVLEAMKVLKTRKGTSVMAIQKYMEKNYTVNMNRLKPHLKKFLEKAVKEGILEQISGHGLTGAFKLNKEAVKKGEAIPRKDLKKQKNIHKDLVKDLKKQKNIHKDLVKDPKNVRKVFKNVEKTDKKLEKLTKNQGKVHKEPAKVDKNPGKVDKKPAKVDKNPGKVDKKPAKVDKNPGKVDKKLGKVRKSKKDRQKKK